MWPLLGVNIFDPRYAILIIGMIFGNAIAEVDLGIKTFNENARSQRERVDALTNIDNPTKILMPIAN